MCIPPINSSVNFYFKQMLDLNKSELFILSCLGIPTLFFGFYPDPLINTIEVSISDFVFAEIKDESIIEY